MDIYITRHGQTDWNTVWKLQGRTDIELNGTGIGQARRTGEGLKAAGIEFDAVYSSPLRRAMATAELMGGLPREQIRADGRLVELSFGSAEGTTPEDRRTRPELAWFNDFFDAPERYEPKDGAETFASALARTADFWESEIRPLEGRARNVLVVTHGGALQSLLLHIDGRSLADYWSVKFPNCSLNLVSLKGGAFRMEWTSRLFC